VVAGWTDVGVNERGLFRRPDMAAVAIIGVAVAAWRWLVAIGGWRLAAVISRILGGLVIYGRLAS